MFVWAIHTFRIFFYKLQIVNLSRSDSWAKTLRQMGQKALQRIIYVIS